MSARASAACEAGGQDDATAIGSLVGDGPALPYVGWRESQDLLTADEFFKNPERAKLPKEDERLFVVLASIAGAAVASKDLDKWNMAWIGCFRGADMGKVDVAAIAARLLAAKENMPKGAQFSDRIKVFRPMLDAAGV